MGDSEAGQGDLFVLLVPEPPKGTLVLENLSQGSSVYVDGSLYGGSSVELPVGSHTLSVHLFGYREFDADFAILRDQSTLVPVEYERANFAIESLEARPRSFDPADPGYLGSCEAKVAVDAPGTGTASVIDASGRKVRELGRLAFASPVLRFRWDGRDDAGAALPPGDYLIRVEGAGLTGESTSAEATVSIVSGLYARSSSLYSGVSGALFAPDARGLAAGILESSVGAELHLSPNGATMSGLGTAHAGIRVGLPSSSGASEVDFSFMSVLWQDDPSIDSYSVVGAWKHTLGSAPIASPTQAAVYVKASYASFFSADGTDTAAPSWDGTTRYSGISVGLPLEYDSGAARAFVSPELEVSNYYPGWAAAGASWATPGFFSWGYLRLGLEATAGPYVIAFSGALRSSPFGGPFAIAGPYPLGLEVRWHARSSPLSLSFIATGEIEDFSNYYFGAGLSLGYRY